MANATDIANSVVDGVQALIEKLNTAKRISKNRSADGYFDAAIQSLASAKGAIRKASSAASLKTARRTKTIDTDISSLQHDLDLVAHDSLVLASKYQKLGRGAIAKYFSSIERAVTHASLMARNIGILVDKHVPGTDHVKSIKRFGNTSLSKLFQPLAEAKNQADFLASVKASNPKQAELLKGIQADLSSALSKLREVKVLNSQ